LNKKNLEKLDEISVKTSKKSEIKNSKEEKTQKTEQKAKNQPENEDFALENSVVASGSTVEFQVGNLNAQENSDFSDFLADDSEKIGEIDSKSEKTFFLDKDKKISVQDFRSDNVEKNPDEKNEKSVVEISEIHRDEKNNPQVTIDFAAASANQNIISSDNQTAGATGSNFQAMLANQIQENAGEIVKAGNIVLKDNDVGSIKLILHPESLGNVKIDLHLNDKNISGKIIVATQEAFNAFKETAENLKQAFTQNGFDSVGLELSLANQGFGQNNPGENQNNPAVEFAMRKIYGELNIFSEGNSEEIEFLENSSRNSVNIVA
jgi:flagellar hook-length control protein FliK